MVVDVEEGEELEIDWRGIVKMVIWDTDDGFKVDSLIDWASFRSFNTKPNKYYQTSFI